MSGDNQKYVIFDLDGTLIDSFECVLRCVNKALDTFSLPHVDIPPSDRHGDIDIIFDKAKRITVDKLDSFDFKKRFDEIHSCDYLKSVLIMDHILEKLVKYYEDGMGIIILTNKYLPIAEKICKEVLSIEAIVIGRTHYDLMNSKGNYLEHFCESNNISINQILCYYGDTQQDELISLQFNIPFYYVFDSKINN